MSEVAVLIDENIFPDWHWSDALREYERGGAIGLPCDEEDGGPSFPARWPSAHGVAIDVDGTTIRGCGLPGCYVLRRSVS